MTKFFKALGAALIAAGLVVAGVASPAVGASMSASANTSGALLSSGTNPANISVTFTTVTPGADSFTITAPTGWTAVNSGAICNSLGYGLAVGAVTCSASGSGALVLTFTKSSGTWPGATMLLVDFPTASLNLTSSTQFSFATYSGVTQTDTANATLTQVGGSNPTTPTMFTVSNASIVDSNSTAITNLPASSGIPAFTATSSGFSNSAVYSMAGAIFSKPGNTEYFSLSNAVNTMVQGAPTPASWSPGSATCGVTAITLGGIAQSGSSGITCQLQTWTIGSTNAYAVRVYLPADTSASISVTYAANLFTSGSAGTYNFRLALASTTQNNTYFTGSQLIPITVGGVQGNNSVSSASAALTLSASTGQLVAGSNVGVVASGLQSTAAYTVTVESTPQTIGTGNATNGAVNTSVTLPSGLEAGWHTLTFTSTASDGTAVVSKYFFKVSASGALLSTSSTIPTELANTGINSTNGFMFLLGGLSLALIGAEMIMIARRKRSN